MVKVFKALFFMLNVVFLIWIARKRIVMVYTDLQPFRLA